MTTAYTARFPSLRREGVVNDPRLWASSAGYEFSVVWGHADLATTMAATNFGLTGCGWTTFIPVTEGSAGDFLSSSDVDPTRMASAIADTVTSSPRIFGSYDHGLMAARFLGYFPTKLTMECYARFSVASSNITTAYIGMAGSSNFDAAAAACAGAIRSGGTASTFFLTSDLGSDAGAAIDTNWHLWRIEFGVTNTEWFQDGVSQGTITTETDIWPLCFRAYSGAAATANRPDVAWVRVFYS